MKLLYLPLEFNKWYSAKKMSYSVGVGLVEGLPQTVEHLTIPIMYHWQSDRWIGHIQSLIGSQTFDQIWMEVVHSSIPVRLFEWLMSMAPIRVGFVIESLTIDSNEYVDNPMGTHRRQSNLQFKLPYLTHAMVCDQRDLKKLGIPTIQYSTTIPERLVRPPSLTADPAVFYGTLYGERKSFVEPIGPRLQINPPSPEMTSDLPRMFEQIVNSSYTVSDYPVFFENWYYARQALYSLWINHLHTMNGCAMVNLPHRTAVASGRVIEGMAAGKPVISPYLEEDDRFEDGENILFYKDQDGLIAHIDRLRADFETGFRIAQNARVNVLENYTTEVLVKRILELTNV